MKDGGWIPVDKGIVVYLPKDRPYTFLEAYISFRADLEDKREYSINGYAKLWSWSRCKVREFLTRLKTSLRQGDRQAERHDLRLIFNNLHVQKDTPKDTPLDSGLDTTINPNKNLCQEVINDLNQKGCFRYKATGSNAKHINARLSEGFKVEDFYHVNTVMIARWKNDPKMAQYLRPATLYNSEKFQGYLNVAAPVKMKKIMGPDGMPAEVPDI